MDPPPTTLTLSYNFPYFVTETKLKVNAVSEAGRENSSCRALVVKGEGVEEGGEIRGVKRRCEAEGWSGGVGCTGSSK